MEEKERERAKAERNNERQKDEEYLTTKKDQNTQRCQKRKTEIMR